MIAPNHVEELFSYANGMQPREMCGLMFSQNRFVRCTNVSPDPLHSFEIEYHEYLQHMALFGEAPWATVHSHPNGSAHLSMRDCHLLDALEVVGNPMKMIIVGLKPRQIRIYAKEHLQYKIEWKWDLEPVVNILTILDAYEQAWMDGDTVRAHNIQRANPQIKYEYFLGVQYDVSQKVYRRGLITRSVWSELGSMALASLRTRLDGKLDSCDGTRPSTGD